MYKYFSMLDESITSLSPEVATLWKSRATSSHEPVCAIDMGSKTFKLVGGYRDDQQIVTRLLEKATLDLGAEITSTGGSVRAAKLAEIEAVLTVFRAHSKRKGITRLIAIGTAAIKRASNSHEILGLAHKLGIEMEIATGRREGELGYLAATGGKPDNLVCELGSWSSQIAWMTRGTINTCRISTGYVHAYREYFLNAASLGDASAAYRDYLDRHIVHLPSSMSRLTALTATSCTRFVTGLKKKQVTGTSLSRTDLCNKTQALHTLTTGEFDLVKRQAMKADKVLPGLVFLDYVMERSGHDRAFITDVELPVGLIVEHFKRPH